MRIPVTRNFDTADLIGYLTLSDEVEISPDSVFAFAYIIQERDSNGKPSKVQVQNVSLIPDSNYLAYLKRETDEQRT